MRQSSTELTRPDHDGRVYAAAFSFAPSMSNTRIAVRWL
jgi:hypothetical protein